MTNPARTVSDYLREAPQAAFRRRRALHEKFGGGPRWLARAAFKRIWEGGFRHLREFDHSYAFEREGTVLSAMAHEGRKTCEAVALDGLVGRIGRPVTIAAMGPSAGDFDWEGLRASGRMVVGVTGGATFLRERGVIPDLMVVTDPDFAAEGGYHIRDAEGVPLAVEYRAAVNLQKFFPGTFEGRRVTLIERVNRWYGLPALENDELERMNGRSGSPFRLERGGKTFGQIGWSDRVDLGFCPSSTVAFVALQIVVGLGATDIEIVGMDLGGGRGIYADARASRLEAQYESIILPSFRVMAEALAGRGVRIANLSPRCPLPREIFDGGCDNPVPRRPEP